jgi:HEAT repeat protein
MRALPILLLVLLGAPAEEPRFEGRTAVEWARVFEGCGPDDFAGHVARLAAGGEKALAVLVKMLASESEIACWSIPPLEAMGERAAPAIPALVRAMGREDLGFHVIDVLAAVGPRAVPALCEALESPSRITRLYATCALQCFLPARQAVEGLTHALKDKSADVRMEAASGLRPSCGPAGREAVAGLTRALGDENADVRLAATTTLGNIESEEAATIRGLVLALRDAREKTREEAATALLHVGIATGPVADDLLASLESESIKVRKWVSAALADLASGPGGRVPLNRIRALLSSKDPMARRAALHLAEGCGPAARELVPHILAGLRDKDVEFRVASAHCLGGIPHSSMDAVRMLLMAVESGPPELRDAAAWALRALDAAANVILPRLRARLAKEPDPTVRLSILRSLHHLDPERVDEDVADLRRILETADTRTATSALYQLWDIASAATIPALTWALGHEDEGIRETAADSLGSLGPLAAPAKDALRRLEKDSSLLARSAAVSALARIDDRPAEGAARLRAMLEKIDAPLDQLGLLERIHDLGQDAEFVSARVLKIFRNEPVEAWDSCALPGLLDVVRDIALAKILAGLDDTANGLDVRLSECSVVVGGKCDSRDDLAFVIRWLGEDAVPGLVGPLRNARAVSVRWRVALALGEMEVKPASAVPALIEALRDSREDLRVRWAAAMSLAKIPKRLHISIPALLATLSEEDLRLRWYAIDALGAYGAAAAPAIKSLEILAEHPDLGPAARAALDAIRPK